MFFEGGSESDTLSESDILFKRMSDSESMSDSEVCQTRKSMSDSENSMSDSEKCVRLGKTLQKSEITLRDELS